MFWKKKKKKEKNAQQIEETNLENKEIDSDIVQDTKSKKIPKIENSVEMDNVEKSAVENIEEAENIDDIDDEEVEDIEDIEDIDEEIEDIEDIDDIDDEEVEDIEDIDDIDDEEIEDIDNIEDVDGQFQENETINNDLIITENITASMEANNAGVKYKSEQKLSEALEMYNRAISSYPGYAIAYYNRAILHTEQNQMQEAIKDYTKAIEINPKDPEFYNNRGNLYAQIDNFILARQDYDFALKLAPNYSQAYHNRGMVHAKEKQFESALVDLTRAVELNGKINCYNIACVYSLINNADKSLEFLEKSFRKGFLNLNLVNSDPDLNNIKNLPAFQDLLDRVSSLSPNTMAMKHFAK